MTNVLFKADDALKIQKRAAGNLLRPPKRLFSGYFLTNLPQSPALLRAYSKGTTAPSYFSLMNFLISSDFNTFTRAWISSLFSLPSFTAMMFT